MSKILIFIGFIGGIILLIFLLFLFSSKGDDFPTKVGPDTVFPDFVDKPTDNNLTSKEFEIAVFGDPEFKVSNFVENGETVQDPSNVGTYILAGSSGYCLPGGDCPSGFDVTSFSVSYSHAQDFFTLVILEEPIADSRKKAEFFLMSRLGIDEQEMCQLHYSFSIPYWVNEFYAGEELGFSFCPGSVSLE